MFGNERVQAVRQLIFDYVRSPSLRHLRDPHSLDALVRQVIKAIDREPAVWRKWEGQREELLRAAACCWVPHDELARLLNSMPGPQLTLTDVAQRLRVIHEEPYSSYPDEALQEGCLAVFEDEKGQGTELPAIIGALQQFVEAETERRRAASDAAYRHRRLQERQALEDRFLAGADCAWTPVAGSKDMFTRKNGRAYRLSATKDKRWQLSRITSVTDPGAHIGVYGTRGDVAKALAKLAYEPEPRW